MPRPVADTVQVTVRLQPALLTRIRALVPETRHHSDPDRFGHGALAKYLTRIINQDLRKRGEAPEPPRSQMTLDDLIGE